MAFDRNGIWTTPDSTEIEKFKKEILSEVEQEVTPTPSMIQALEENIRAAEPRIEAGVSALEWFNTVVNAVGSTVDIVIPVYDGLHVLKKCIRSIEERTHWPYNLIVVNDGSPDPRVKEYLDSVAFVSAVGNFKVIHNSKNRGFPAAVNRGVFSSSSEYVCILNSDVIVTDRWLTKMVFALAADERNQIVNPITNNTSLINVEMYRGRDYLDMNHAVELQRNYRYPEIMPTGFCYMVRRSLIDKIGMFDEGYGAGFGEETHHWQQAVQYTDENGHLPRYRAVLADNAYVYHERGSSFSQLGDEIHMGARRGGNERFHRLNPNYREWIKGFDVNKAINPLRVSIPKEAFKRTKKKNVAWLVKSAGPCGGMYYIADIVNEMIEQGHNVKVCVLPDNYKEDEPLSLVGCLRTMPLIFQNETDLIDNFKTEVFDEGLVIAAVSELTPIVTKLMKNNNNLRGINHVQSYDPALAASMGLDEKIPSLEKAYLDLPNLVNSNWVANKIEALGGKVIDIIHPGINTDLFHIRDRSQGDDRFTIGVMTLKNYPFKRYDRAVEICTAIHEAAIQQNREVRIMAIGQESMPECPYVIGLGGLSQSRMATLLGTEIDVLIDPAELHSYGLPGLEALASGCVYACWEGYGVHEYKEHFLNDQICIIKEDDIEEAALEILDKSGNFKDQLHEHIILNLKVPVEHTRSEAVNCTIETLIKTDERPGHGIQIITPHMRKHGGPTTLATLANLLQKEGHDVGMSMIYTDFNPEVLNIADVPIKTSYAEIPYDRNVCIINSDNPFAKEIMHKNPNAKFIMMKLSHNARFKETEAGNLDLKWSHIMTSTEWLRQACLNCLPEWQHSVWDPNLVTNVGWYHYGHKIFNYHPSNRVYGDMHSGIRLGALIHDHPLKGTQTAIEAVAGLKKKWEASLIPAGVGECKAKLPFYWQYYNSLSRNNMANLFRQLDIWLSCSHTEGLGRMPLEAMSSGVAIVASRTGAEYMIDRENCLLYEPGDAQRAAELVDELIRDRELFKKLVINGYKTACEAADPTRFIKNVNEIIQTVIEK